MIGADENRIPSSNLKRGRGVAYESFKRNRQIRFPICAVALGVEGFRRWGCLEGVYRASYAICNIFKNY